MTDRRRAFLYTQDFPPSAAGAGSGGRVYSNARAYLDLGYDLEIVFFQTRPAAGPVTQGLEQARWTTIPLTGHSAVIPRAGRRVAYWLGYPFGAAMNYGYRTRPAIRREIVARARQSPGAIHHFEYVSTACAAVGLQGLTRLWSVHDIESRFQSEHLRIRNDLHGPRDIGANTRRIALTTRVERAMAQEFDQLLCIAQHETDEIRREWQSDRAVFFPMSIPVEKPPVRTRDWCGDGTLVLLHLGRIDSLPSYRSLEFLLTKVLPATPTGVRDALVVDVVGEVRDSDRARQILALAEPFPQVRFHGFQEDIRPWYAAADLQIVGSSAATGLRTRVVESFAYGLPVLGTTTGVEGVCGLEHGVNVRMEDSPGGWVSTFEGFLRRPAALQALATAGQATYSRYHSRAAVAEALGQILSRVSPAAH